MRGLSTPAEAQVQPARQAGHFWVDTGPRNGQDPPTEKIDHRSLNAAWRHDAETWLRCQGLITVSINKKVLPNYPLKYAYR
jgi:hypothetical protein